MRERESMCVCDKTNNVGVCSLHLFTLQLCTEVKVMSPKVIRNSNICVCVCVCVIVIGQII